MNTKKWLTLPLILTLAAAPFALSEAPAVEPTTRSATTADATGDWPTVADELTGDARLLAIVNAITAWQIEARGEVQTMPLRADAPDAVAAAAALAAQHGKVLPADMVLGMSLLTPELDAALSNVLVDFAAYEAETVAAFHGFDVDAARADTQRAGELRLAGVMVAQETLLASLLELRAVLQATPVHAPVVFVLPNVFHIDLTQACDDNVYTDDVPLLIDECGNDSYANNAGGGGAIGNPVGTIYPLAAALADFDGDDAYVSGHDNAVNGGAFAGAGFLFDGAGSDIYTMPEANDGVNGGGSIGSGFLVDDGQGTDVYAAGGWGTNGAGYIGGRGLLVEMGGDEVYSGTHDAVNGGGAGGNGALWDDGGNDAYTAWFIGANGGGVAGTGLLYDRSGFDVYSDDAGGSGTDVTLVPKEVNGAQIDDA